MASAAPENKILDLIFDGRSDSEILEQHPGSERSIQKLRFKLSKTSREDKIKFAEELLSSQYMTYNDLNSRIKSIFSTGLGRAEVLPKIYRKVRKAQNIVGPKEAMKIALALLQEDPSIYNRDVVRIVKEKTGYELGIRAIRELRSRNNICKESDILREQIDSFAKETISKNSEIAENQLRTLIKKKFGSRYGIGYSRFIELGGSHERILTRDNTSAIICLAKKLKLTPNQVLKQALEEFKKNHDL